MSVDVIKEDKLVLALSASFRFNSWLFFVNRVKKI